MDFFIVCDIFCYCQWCLYVVCFILPVMKCKVDEMKKNRQLSALCQGETVSIEMYTPLPESSIRNSLRNYMKVRNINFHRRQIGD